MIEVRELAVSGERRDLEVDRAVAAIGVPVRLERLDRIAHRGDVGVVRGAGILLVFLEAERRRVLHERVDVAAGVLAQRQAGLLRFEDGPVVDVGEVHHLADVVAGLVLQRAAQDVERDERPEIADVAAGVGGEAARVHADEIASGGCEVLFASCQGVVQAHRDG
jgi:hypothetical protein